jgi:hypothetical protein
MRAVVCVLSGLCLIAAAGAQPAPPLSADWAPFQFLLGRWDASGGGAPGASTGWFSFEPAAGGNAILRRNESVSPNGRHLDTLLMYREATGAFRAVYADNEGHVIHYGVTPTAEPKGATFLSDETPGVPRFRLVYRLEPDAGLHVAFEIAPPGSSEFKTYAEGVGRIVP